MVPSMDNDTAVRSAPPVDARRVARKRAVYSLIRFEPRKLKHRDLAQVVREIAGGSAAV
ncbi:MAG: hypothetical protein IKX54_01485 [Lachnospiraceae bacterium]|nr:hypothetical protein [Lachnospiraceae bacterium]